MTVCGKNGKSSGSAARIKTFFVHRTAKNIIPRVDEKLLKTQGYLSVTAVMFNEDIQQKFEPTLGRNEYWVEIFGDPSSDNYWGWKLEGHHLSLNFTFKGNKMISNSPFLMAQILQTL